MTSMSLYLILAPSRTLQNVNLQLAINLTFTSIHYVLNEIHPPLMAHMAFTHSIYLYKQ
jgi:hypothetical protein